MRDSGFKIMKTLIVIPCLNEAAHIEALVRQLAANRGTLDMLIVVADGGSSDGTVEIVERLKGEITGLELLSNPKRLQAPAINLAVETYGADRHFLIRIDAHGDYPEDYCRVLLEEAIETGAESVVVGMKTVGSALFQRAAAVAQNSKLGNGGSKHRDGGGGHWVDHAHHALMRIDAFRAVGGYDETFSHNEDAELDHRLRFAGFRLWMTGRTYMIYYPRRTAPALFRQYLGYGRGRARNLLKHRVLPKVRQAIPLAVVPVCIAVLLSFVHWIFAVPFLLWAGLCLAYGVWIAISERNSYGLLAGVAAMIMHFAWSAGFWAEFLSLKRRRSAA
ncbi:glycosyltransferase family 2 protein [Rhizobium halophytocola]|uniref:Succinoglycan biosynthesis protein ExoA n=1 Tax=Rhizobium halophytocola TaxID=735519 RepID=A0ABS4E4S7_9HYPH|nr:glycosyltransferase family 2 protein [Rhizobium halophytocola]MBP1852956.1 succinoglycan biosynthesis protein ExoA [Rhizobium halophytocola]